MKKTFKDLVIGEVFTVPNTREVFFNRGNSFDEVTWSWNWDTLRFKKQDEQGATSFYNDYYRNWSDGCYYRIDPNNPVERCQ